jgi:hypothetical protein
MVIDRANPLLGGFWAFQAKVNVNQFVQDSRIAHPSLEYGGIALMRSMQVYLRSTNASAVFPLNPFQGLTLRGMKRGSGRELVGES